MCNTVTLIDYSIDKGVFRASVETDRIFEKVPAIRIEKIRHKEIYDDIHVERVGENMFQFELDLNGGNINTGTWYPVLCADDEKYLMKYNNMLNDKSVGRMIELSESKLYFDTIEKVHFMGALDKESCFVIRKWKDGNEGISKSGLIVKEFILEGNSITFTLNRCFDRVVEQAEIWVWNKSQRILGRKAVSDISEGANTFSVDISAFDIVKKTNCDRVWEVYLVMNYYGTYRQSRIELRGKDFLSKNNIRKTIADESARFIIAESEEENVLQVYFNKLARLCSKTVPQAMQYKERYRAEATDIDVKNGKLYIKVELRNGKYDEFNMFLRSINDITGEAKEYIFGREKEWFVLDFDKVIWNELTKYELTLLASKSGHEYEFRLIKGNDTFPDKLAKVYKYCHKTDEDYLIFLAETIGGKITVEYRKKNQYDSIKYRINEKLALMLYRIKASCLFRNDKKEEKKLLLFYEKFCMAAQDNSFYMFEYFVDKNNNNIVPRYVLDKSAPDYKRLRKQYGKKIVPFMSIRHLYELQKVKMFVSTDSKRHCYRWHAGSTVLAGVIEEKPFVFLQHGVLGLKKVDYIYSSQFANKASMFITSSEFERDIVERFFGYSKNEIVITGLARWDMLEDKSEQDRMIFYMPTWRNWILETDSQEFVNTKYYKACSEIINSKKLNDILEKNDAKLIFCLHPKFRQYSGQMNSKLDRISIVDFADCKINELLMKCKMFITDYSSAAWDVYYMEKPVLFYQFDVEQYLETQGSYINFENGLFGDRATGFEDFLKKLDDIATGGFKEKSCYGELREKYLPVRDKSNRKRIYDNIMEKLQ